MNDPEPTKKIDTPETDSDKQQESNEGMSLKEKIKSSVSNITRELPGKASDSESSQVKQDTNNGKAQEDLEKQVQGEAESGTTASSDESIIDDNLSSGESPQNEIEMVDSTPKLYDEINQVRQEYRQTLDSEKELLQEEIEEAVDGLQDDLEAQKSTWKRR
ncbi:MAG: hypothetical protein J07AB43_07140 [Candidatus Nanosalina sp. J07AB43]|nr:MAG: hypothetical protein J07AB43_07140 [Candidatus Nanosalina sp. J07AB43]